MCHVENSKEDAEKIEAMCLNLGMFFKGTVQFSEMMAMPMPALFRIEAHASKVAKQLEQRMKR